MSSRAVKNKLPRIIFRHRPSSRGGEGSVFVHWAKMIIDDSCEDEPLMALSNDPHSRPHARWTECVFFCVCVAVGHSHIQKQRSEAIVQLQIPQKKEATFCPRRPTFTTGRLRKLQQGNVHATLVFTCTGALVLDVWYSQTPLGPATVSRSSFFDVVSLMPLPPFSHFFSGQSSRGTGWEESLNPGYVYTVIVCNCVWACN